MTLETCNEKCRQSARVSDYMIANPSNNTDGVSNCVNLPGLVCRSLNVKHYDSVDTETVLLRGAQSVGIEPPSMPMTNKGVFPTTFTKEPFAFLGENTRTSKSCNGERDLMGRFEAPFPVPYDRNFPLMTPGSLVGTNSRNLAKYGEK